MAPKHTDAPETPETPETPALPPRLTALAAHEEFTGNAAAIPDEIKEWVEAGYAYWLEHKDKWRQVILPTVQDVTDVLRDADEYAKKVRDIPLTIQRRGAPEITEEGVRLVYRVRDKVRSGRPVTGPRPAGQ